MQLRLVEGPTREPVRRRADADARGDAPAGHATKASKGATAAKAGKQIQGRPLRGAVNGGVQGSRAGRGSRGRAVHWADWQLDARTRRVGRAGVAAAKAALEQAARPDPGTPLSKAS